MRKSRFELGHGDGWCDFEYPVAIRRQGQVVGWASEADEASLLLYAANTRKESSRYLPRLAEKLTGGLDATNGFGASLEVDTSAGSGASGVAGCGVALTCNGRVVAWLKDRRHARLIAESVNRATRGEQHSSHGRWGSG